MKNSSNIFTDGPSSMRRGLGNLKLIACLAATLTFNTSCDKTTIDPIGTKVVNPGNKILTGDAAVLSPTKSSITSRFVNFSIKPFSQNSTSITVLLNGVTSVTLSKNISTGNFDGLSPELPTGNYSISVIEKNGSESRTTNSGVISFTQVVPNDVTANQKMIQYDGANRSSMDRDSLDMLKVQFPNYLKNKDKLDFYVIDLSLNNPSSPEFANITTKNMVTGGTDGGNTTSGHGSAVASNAFATSNNGIGMSGASSLSKEHNFFLAVGEDFTNSTTGKTETSINETAYIKALEYVKNQAKNNPDRCIVVSLSVYLFSTKTINSISECKKIPNIILVGGTGNDSVFSGSQKLLSSGDYRSSVIDVFFGGVEGNDVTKNNPRTYASDGTLVAIPSSYQTILYSNGNVKDSGPGSSEISYSIPVGAQFIVDIIRAGRGEPGFNKDILKEIIAQSALDIIESSMPSATTQTVGKGRDKATGYGLFRPHKALELLAKKINITLNLNQ